MKAESLEILVFPKCRSELVIKDGGEREGEIQKGTLFCIECSNSFPIRNYIPRFVPDDNYAASFGMQWNIHAKTQIDKFNGTTISQDRLFEQTRWTTDDLRGQYVLECGCGAGRFTQVLLDAGAICFSFDFSRAVDANWANNGPHGNLHLFQADISPFANSPSTR